MLKTPFRVGLAPPDAVIIALINSAVKKKKEI